jgi:spore coat polysaccharide biosynthesis protein SpsF (cytidylyltransferase family)
MDELTRVLIAIQARSGNTRLPRKCFEPLGSKRLLDHVIDSCLRAAKYSNKFTTRKNFTTSVALIVPYGDPIIEAFGSQLPVMEGPEEDVLTRYVMAQRAFNADFVCRITGDCPLIPSYVISKHLSLAVVGECDYVSNVEPACRTTLDGIDCEVMSKKLLHWLDVMAKSPEEREHVTPLARSAPPEWAKRAVTMGYFDQSDLKLSVDTREDLEAVRKQYKSIGQKLDLAEQRYGRASVHRF